MTLFCTEEPPHKFRATCFVTSLSERWHRVAIQQAAGIAQSWCTNRAQAYQDYVDDLLDYREALDGKTINTSVTLNKRDDGWWLTLSYDEVVPIQTEPTAPVIGVDVGIANFVTTSDSLHYGTFHGKLRERQKRDREKRRRKAKLRKCLEKMGVEKLPSTRSKSGQRQDPPPAQFVRQRA